MLPSLISYVTLLQHYGSEQVNDEKVCLQFGSAVFNAILKMVPDEKEGVNVVPGAQIMLIVTRGDSFAKFPVMTD